MSSEEFRRMEGRDNLERQERLASEAAKWVADGTLSTPTEAAQFEQWLCESPENVKEFLAASAWNETLPNDLADSQLDVNRLLSGSNVVHVRGSQAADRDRPNLSRPRRSLVAACATVIAAAILVVALPVTRDLWPANRYATSVGEQRTIALPDGSIIAMNIQSRVRVAYSSEARTVYLLAGQAMFSVAHDASRPFRVHVDDTVVQAIGTKFDIRRMGDSTTIAVIEGRVQVIAPNGHAPHESFVAIAERMRLAAGEAVQVLENGALTQPAPIDLSEVNAWQQRRLVFRDDSLRDILDEFQRYNPMRIRIDGEDLSQQRYSGVWDADHPEDLLAYLSSSDTIRVTRDGDWYVIRSSPPTD